MIAHAGPDCEIIRESAEAPSLDLVTQRPARCVIVDLVGKRNTTRSVPMSAQAIFVVVRRCAGELGVHVRPHDLRRTFAKLAHQGGAPVEQIQLSLGHTSLLTPERYLGVAQDLSTAPCDFLGLRL
jgi:integrase